MSGIFFVSVFREKLKKKAICSLTIDFCPLFLSFSFFYFYFLYFSHPGREKYAIIVKVSLFSDGFLACADPFSNMTASTSHPGALQSTLAASKTENASLSIKRKNKNLCYSQALRLPELFSVPRAYLALAR